jgi:serine/threonine-protein kinase
MSTPSNDLAGRLVAGRYRLLGPVGAGASARVFVADDTDLERLVAVKIMHPAAAGDAKFLRRFQSEARLAAAVNNRNVMHVYDTGTDDDLPYLVSEYLRGGSLRAMIDAGERLSPSQALVVGLECARGLIAAQRHGLVHRDIKSANLLFDSDGVLRIADFGVARALAESSWTEPDGMLIGTARYASPEQARGLPADHRSDIYSLALVLCEAVTGQVPFSEDTTTATLMARCQDDLVPPAELGRLAGVVAWAGKLEPDERPDAEELEIALLAAAEDLPRPEPFPLVISLTDDDVAEMRAALDQAELAGDASTDGPDETDSAAENDTNDDADTTVAGAADHETAHLGTSEADDVDGADVATVGVITVVSATSLDDTNIDKTTPTPHLGATPTQPDAAAAAGDHADGGTGTGTGTATDDAEVSAAAAAAAESTVAESTVAASVSTSDATKANKVANPAEPVETDEPSGRRGRRRTWIVALVVIALVAAGIVTWLALRTPSAPVPNLIGVTREEATNRLRTGRWTVETRFERRNGTKPEEVIAQDPAPKTDLPEKRTVKLTVSLGNELTTVPKLDTLAEAQANEALAAAGLVVGKRSEQNDETVPAGVVISHAAQVDAQGQMPRESPVDLVISVGPAKRTIPAGLVGQDISAVKRALEGLQLKVNVVQQFSADRPANIVMAVSQADNAQVDRGSVIDVTVSKGPEPKPIPNLVGQPVTQATAALAALGFSVSAVEGSPANPVLATDPGPGSLELPGRAVRLFTKR